MTSDSLESLWADARKHTHAAKKSKAADKPIAPPIEPRRLFADPANWLPTRGVALIHADSETLLGNFTEYVHKSVPNCRRLVHEDRPLPVTGVERVAGSWWLEERPKPAKLESWYDTRPHVLHIDLQELGVHAPCVEVQVCLEFGAIARVELSADTTFASESEELLFLPAGTDILPVMSLDCKIQLRKDLSI